MVTMHLVKTMRPRFNQKHSEVGYYLARAQRTRLLSVLYAYN